MARLIIQTPGLGKQTIDLRAGVNHVGRSRNCEIHLPHLSVSTVHAELVATDEGLHLRDCGSTNGTFVDGVPCRETWLIPGQQLRFGHVDLVVESTEATVAIPQLDQAVPPPPPPTVLEDGRPACARHPENNVTFRCTHCTETMCNRCVRVIGLKGRPPHFLCRVCSHPAVPAEDPNAKKKKNFFAQLQETLKSKFPFTRGGGK
jgi:hypothetical protein